MNATAPQNKDAINDQLDAWTAHKTEAEIVYYYNALTGESTYDKPAGFKGEVLIHTVCSLSRSFHAVMLSNYYFLVLIFSFGMRCSFIIASTDI